MHVEVFGATTIRLAQEALPAAVADQVTLHIEGHELVSGPAEVYRLLRVIEIDGRQYTVYLYLGNLTDIAIFVDGAFLPAICQIGEVAINRLRNGSTAPLRELLKCIAAATATTPAAVS